MYRLLASAFSILGLGAAFAACSAASSSDPTANAVDAGDKTSVPDGEATDDVGSTTQESGTAVDASPPAVELPPFPVIPNHGGPIIANPEVITITWAADPISAGLEAFDDWMVKSSFWTDLMGEWGVGAGTHPASYRIPTAAPPTLDETGVASLVSSLVDAGHVPPPTSSRIYAIYPPEGTVVTNGGFPGCTGFQAYHYAFQYSPPAAPQNQQIAIYAVAPRCTETNGMSALDFTTWGMSHEIMEASSDPDYFHPAYVIKEQSVETPTLGENADLCVGQAMQVDGYTVTRNWSNVAAKTGKRPCMPAPPGMDFTLMPDDTEVTLDAKGKATVKAHFIANGAGKIRAAAMGGADGLSAKLSATTGVNGDELTVTITALSTFQDFMGANTVLLFAQADGYTTRRAIIVHR